MPAAYHFRDGIIAKRIVKSLQKVTPEDILDLCDSGKIAYFNPANELSYRNLRYNGIEDYSDLSGDSISYYIWGTDNVPAPQYTPNDAELIQQLNRLNKRQTCWLISVILSGCKSPLTEQFHNLNNGGFCSLYNDDTPSIRFRHLLFSWSGNSETGKATSRRLLAEELGSDKKQYLHELPALNDIIDTFITYRRDGVYICSPDYFADLATWMGVSVHWLMGLKRNTIYCKHFEGDLAFDIYTLCRPHYRDFIIQAAKIAELY